jgi:HEPN domain-containing protein
MQKHEVWLSFAKEDLNIALVAMKPEYMMVRSALYHAQQCFEKSLKAYLIFNNIMPPRTHDLTSLLRSCMQINKDFEQYVADAYEINPFSVATRYPDDAYVFPDTDYVHHIIARAQSFFEFVNMLQRNKKEDPSTSSG